MLTVQPVSQSTPLHELLPQLKVSKKGQWPSLPALLCSEHPISLLLRMNLCMAPATFLGRVWRQTTSEVLFKLPVNMKH